MSIRLLDKDKWIIDYYPQGRKGKRNRIIFIGTEKEARIHEIELRKSHQVMVPTNPKVVDVAPDWLNVYKINVSPLTYDRAKNCLSHLLPHFGHLQFNRLTPILIEQYKAKRLEQGVKKATINKELFSLSNIYRWAAENNYTHPLPFKIKVFSGASIKAPKPRIPHPSVIDRLIKAIKKRHLVLVLLLYDAGLRKSEALNLKVENISIQNGIIIVRGKGDKERIIPITTDRLKDELIKSSEGKKFEEYIIVNPETNKPYSKVALNRILKSAAKRAGIEQSIYPHLLRHSFGTHGIHAGISIRALQEIMGHSSVKTTEGYTHLLGDFLKTEGSKFNDYISVVNEKDKNL